MSAVMTRFITGDFVVVLIVAAILTWPVSWALLALYRRAVHRSMRRSGSAPARSAGVPPVPAAVEPSTRAIAPTGGDDAATLLQQLRGRPWQVARVYLAAALGYGATLAVVMAWFAEPEAPFRPVRLLLLTTIFAWPIVPTIAIVAGAVRRDRVAIAAVYAAIYVGLIGIAVALTPTNSAWQLLQLWVLQNLPATVFVALSLSRRIRAVGPMVLVFLLLSLLGASAVIAVVGSSDVLMMWATDLGGWLDLGALGTLLGIALIGFATCAIVGTGLLSWIRRRYEQKRASDESLTIQTIWWLFAFAHAITLAFEHLLAPLTGVVAMGVFTAITSIGFRRTTRTAGRGHALLLLRSFSIGARSEQLFDAFQKHWRRVGSLQMIAGVDLAARTIEPHEFLDFLTGKVSRRFIDGPAALQQRLREMDTRPDRDGRFRVNEFFCYDDTWRDALLALVENCEAVLMDLRGFTRQNAGCVFEIGELFRLLPSDRLVFLVDHQTDSDFLNETFARAAAHVTRRDGRNAPQVLPVQTLDSRTFNDVLSAVAHAVCPRTLTTAGM